MKVIRTLNSSTRKRVKDPVVTLGNFDGIHLGHQLILKKLSARARRLKTSAVVYTFEPHPLKVVAPAKSPPLLLDLEDKKTLLESLGIDFLVLARFTRGFASKHPREFAEDILVKGLGVREVWVGEDFSFGRGRRGTVEYLKELGERYGFRVFVIPPYKKGGSVVSSSRIRALVSEGEVKKAAVLLARPYSIKGSVVAGKEIGKVIGFPTANLKVSSELLPKNGVYAVRASFDGIRYDGVVNIGTAPTFGGKKKTVEVHLFDFKDDIYGKKMRVEFIKRLRDEKHFKTKEALVRQINRDAERAKKVFTL
ncbi:MAG: bifunctional riboflavin kinase/FAD synthetase [Thermodesulfobacteriota bacterium]|nr:MAG: bifunctional riboflavin kinase/FAD synthetase [Thermodesulfobacteriota bacterium]